MNVLIKEKRKFKTWEKITREFKVEFQMDSSSTCNTKLLKKTITEKTTKSQNLSHLNHHLIKSNQLHTVGKLNTKKLYLISLQHETTTSTSHKHFESMFQNLTLWWKSSLYFSTYYRSRF